MRNAICNIYTFRTRHFTVKVDALPEYEPVDMDDDGETAEAVYRGNLVHFCAHAYVEGPRGETLAEDYLGSCIYEDYADFMDHRGIGRYATMQKYKRAIKARDWQTAQWCRWTLYPNHCVGSYFSDMINIVCREARRTWNATPHVKLRNTEEPQQ